MRIRLSVFRRGLNFSCMDTSKDFVPLPRVSYSVPPFSWNLSQPRALPQLLKFNLPVLQSVQYEQGLISCWRALSSNSFVNSMFPTKEKSDQAVFSFLDLILLMPASFHRLTLNYCNKNPPDTPSIPIEPRNMNPDLNVLLERKAVLAAEIFFLIWDRKKVKS